MDSKVLRLKQILHKPIECSHCRNLRISNELESLNEMYEVLDAVEAE